MSKETGIPLFTDADKGLNDALKQQLECPVCFYTCLPPIYMCSNGHIVCNKCSGQVSSCAVCREDGSPKIRNIFAEESSSKIRFPCSTLDEDCKGMFTVDEMARHLSVCHEQFSYFCRVRYTTVQGSLVNCDFRGKRTDLVAHVQEKHPAAYYYYQKVELSVDPSKPFQQVRLVSTTDVLENTLYLNSPILVTAYEQYFWCNFHMNQDNTALAAYATYVGGRKAAARYYYRVRIALKDQKQFIEFTGPVLQLVNTAFVEYTKEKHKMFYIHKDTFEALMVDGRVHCTMEILRLK